MSLANQSVYIGQAQTIQDLWNGWLQIYEGIQRINALQAKLSSQNVWKAMATAAQNADGSIGAADGSPVNTDPITVSGMNAMTANDIINALNDLIALAEVFDGTGGNGIMTGAIDHRSDAISVTRLTA